MGENFKMDLQEVGWGMNWIVLTQDRDRGQVFEFHKIRGIS